MSEEQKAIDVMETMLRMLANKNRINILYALLERAKTWTELIFELRMNPKTLKHHLDYLRREKLVTENEPQGFRLTEGGRAFMVLSIKDIISTVKKAKEILDESNK